MGPLLRSALSLVGVVTYMIIKMVVIVVTFAVALIVIAAATTAIRTKRNHVVPATPHPQLQIQAQAHESATLLEPIEPSDYNGDPHNARRFICNLEAYFWITRTTAVEERVLYALSKIDGGSHQNATLWVDTTRSTLLSRKREIRAITAANAAPGAILKPIPAEYFATWKEFADKFMSYFGPLLGEQAEAIAAMRQLQQGDMTCTRYIDIFKMHYRRSGYNEVAGLEEFRRGLTKGLRLKLWRTFPLPANNPDGTVNMQNWMDRAEELDKHYRNVKLRLQRLNNGSRRGQGNR